MKKKAVGNHDAQPKASGPGSAGVHRGKIHPVIIYPFIQPGDRSDLEGLYRLIALMDADKEKYARPVTVVDRKTHLVIEENKVFLDFRKNVIARHSDILDAWCVDTCQMWYSGLGLAFDRGGPDDVYWLIPGDFNYGSAAGQEVLGRLHDLPEIIQDLKQDFCIGEITVDPNHSKQLIDTFGTFALLYNWFPAEAREIRRITARPRSEFFAIRHGFLREVLGERWYAYEQTLVILLKAFLSNKQITRFCVGDISDLPQGHESLASAIQQVERTERVLKSIWRERNQSKAGWASEYRVLENQSDQIRRAAYVILHNLLS